MSQLIRIGAGVGATALALVLGFAFWPQIDKSVASGRAAVEKPVFVVRASPIKLEVATAPQPQAAAPQAAASAQAGAAAAPPVGEVDPALTKLASALRANTPGAQSTSAPELGAPRGLVVAGSGPSAPSEGARRLCAQGLIALAQGYIAGARAYLERAAEAGDARALLALGETYDPAALARIGARGIKGDAARARDYYSQALAAGVGDARERMAALASP
jgi:TPR repeat protein